MLVVFEYTGVDDGVLKHLAINPSHVALVTSIDANNCYEIWFNNNNNSSLYINNTEISQAELLARLNATHIATNIVKIV